MSHAHRRVNRVVASQKEKIRSGYHVTVAAASHQKTRYDTSEVEKAAKELAREFREAASKLDSYFRTSRQRIETGNSLSIMASVLTIGALVAAPFTFGTSILPVVALGAGAAVTGGLIAVVSRVLYDIFSGSTLYKMNKKFTTFQRLYKTQINIPFEKEIPGSSEKTLEELVERIMALEDLREKSLAAAGIGERPLDAIVAHIANIRAGMEDIITTSIEMQMKKKHAAAEVLNQFAHCLETFKELRVRCSFCSRYIASTWSENCDDSDKKHLDISSTINERRLDAEGLLPIFSLRWEKQHLDRKGGQLQKAGSDVILRVPADAVMSEGGVVVHSAVSDDEDDIRRILKLSDKEEVASPLAEFWAGRDFRFQRPVSIILPHCLPEDFDPDRVSVYHVTRRDGTNHVAVSRLNQIKLESDGAAAEMLRMKEPDVPEVKEPCFQVANGHITVFTEHFCLYVCTYCWKEEELGSKYKPILHLMASGCITYQEASDSPLLPPWVDVYAYIWHNKMRFKNKRKGRGIREGELKHIKLLDEWNQEQSKLRLKLRCASDLTPRLDRRGNPLQSEPESADLCPLFGCGACYVRDRQPPIYHHWAMKVDGGPLPEEVAVDVIHEATGQKTTTLVVHLAKTERAGLSSSSIPSLVFDRTSEVYVGNTYNVRNVRTQPSARTSHSADC